MTGRRVELLAPAGNKDALTAALAAGADAVYLGLENWSARAFAGNFAAVDVVRAIERAHLFDAHVHLALNTLLKQTELEPALDALAAPYEAGLDALIVADLGFAALVRARYPDLPLHASTQLNTHSSAQLAALARAGFSRAVLARELSLTEIAALDPASLELETFVHGALCYGYSGLCLLSSMVGGRSGNRGRCSQSCRMKYRLVAGDRQTTTQRTISASDLAAIDSLGGLVKAGVSSLKIEGRNKDAGYVAVATAVYREALDAAMADPDGYEAPPEWLQRLEQSFSRGFTSAHLDGAHSTVRNPARGGHRGVQIGRVETVDQRRGLVTVKLSQAVAGGDVIQIYTPWGHTEPARVGGIVEGAATGESGHESLWEERVTLRLSDRIAVKDRLFRISSGVADEFVREAVALRRLARPIAVSAELSGRVGEPARLTLTLSDPAHRAVADPAHGEVLAATAVGTKPLESARTASLDEAKARDALGALGGTPYQLTEFVFTLEDGVFMAVGAVKDLRRQAIEQLDELRLSGSRRPAPDHGVSRPKGSGSADVPESAAAHRLPAERASTVVSSEAYRSAVIVRVPVYAAPPPAPGVTAWCLDAGPADSIDQITAAFERLAASGLPVRFRPSEILFDTDLDWWTAAAALPWAAVYARHLVHLEVQAPYILEYPLQGLNAEVAGAFLRRSAGGSPGDAASADSAIESRVPDAIVASPESSLDEIAALAVILGRSEPAVEVEILAFGRQQVMVTRDRLGAAEGLVAEPRQTVREDLSLIDEKGFVFPVTVDARGTQIANARVTNVTPHLDDLAGAGVAGLIVVYADLTAAEERAFAARGIAGLAGFADRDRSTGGHLFRGVA